MLKHFQVGAALACLIFTLSGCSDGGAVNVKEGADEQSIEDYKAMVAAEEAANAGSDKSVAKPPK